MNHGIQYHDDIVIIWSYDHIVIIYDDDDDDVIICAGDVVSTTCVYSIHTRDVVTTTLGSHIHARHVVSTSCVYSLQLYLWLVLMNSNRPWFMEK